MNYDVVVIGSGPGGYVAAVRATQLGFKTACIEKENSLGGTCLNVGCIPSKALLQSSEHFDFIKNKAAHHGISINELSFDFKKMMQRKEDVVKGLTDGVASLFKRKGIERINGTAKFLSPQEIEITNSNGKKTIQAKNTIIATGSEPIPLPFLPYDENTILSSTGILSLANIPKALLVIGGGVIGVEIASVYNRLGSKITIVEMLDHITPGMDKDLQKALLQSLKKQGIIFHLSSQVTAGKVLNNGAEITLKTSEGMKQLSSDKVLVAIGRRPYTTGLKLEEIGIEKNSKGFITIDNNFRTTQSNIYAIGDTIDGPMLAHKASEEGIAVADIIAGQNGHVNYMEIPNIVYTHPEAVSVGLTEQEARSKNLSLKIGICQLKANPRARCAGDTDGFVKVIGESNSNRFLGMHIIGPHASEMIGEAVIALEKRATLKDIAHAPHAHPSLGEAIKEAAQQALGEAIHL